MSFSHPDVEGRADDAATHEEEGLALLLAEIEAVGYGPVHLEEHDEVPGEWGAWFDGDDEDAELVGSGWSKREALEDALAQLKVWKQNEGRPSHPRSRFE